MESSSSNKRDELLERLRQNKADDRKDKEEYSALATRISKRKKEREDIAEQLAELMEGP